MSKTGQWLLQMQEDAQVMTKDEFISEHCKSQVHVWEEVQEEMQQEINLEQFQDAQGEMALEDCIKIKEGY
jgi:hypothetical protein